MNPKVQIKIDYLNNLTPMGLVDDPSIEEHFLNKFKATHSGISDELAQNFFNTEALYFKQVLSASNELRQCTMFSLYGCFMDITVNGLSFDPSSKLIYITFRSFNTAPKNAPEQWEKRASNVVSPYGELALRVKYGQIKYADDPIIVYESDFWEPGYREDGSRYCLYKAKIPRSGKIIGSFVKITRADGSFDFPYFTEENIDEWEAASKKQNKGNANSLYGGDTGTINIGFLKAKTIKHSFKTYPKVKILGGNTEMEDASFDFGSQDSPGDFLTSTTSAAAPAGLPASSLPEGKGAYQATTIVAPVTEVPVKNISIQKNIDDDSFTSPEQLSAPKQKTLQLDDDNF